MLSLLSGAAILLVGAVAPSAIAGADTPSTSVATPPSVSIVAGDQEISVQWDTAGNPTDAITAVATGDVTQTCAAPRSDGGCTITGLTDGQAYDVTLSVPASDGTVTSVDEGTATPEGAPAAALSAPAETNVAVGDGSAAVTWTSSGDASVYVEATATNVTDSSDAFSCVALDGSSATTNGCTISDLTDGQTYDVTLQEMDYQGDAGPTVDLGNVTPSAPAGSTVPAAPTNVTLLAQVDPLGGAPVVTASWTAPDDGGSTIFGYTVTLTDSSGVSQTGCTATGDAPTCLIYGLDPGATYSATVTASNGVGTSAPSAEETVTTEAAPRYEPTVTPSGDGTGYTVSFVEPDVSWLDSAPTSFTVSDDSGDSCTASANGAGQSDSCELITASGSEPSGISISPQEELTGVVDPPTTTGIPTVARSTSGGRSNDPAPSTRRAQQVSALGSRSQLTPIGVGAGDTTAASHVGSGAEAIAPPGSTSRWPASTAEWSTRDGAMHAALVGDADAVDLDATDADWLGLALISVVLMVTSSLVVRRRRS